MRDLNLANRLIDALGGPATLARELSSCSSQAISTWRRQGIPPARMDYIRLRWPDVVKAVERANQPATQE